MSDKPCSDCLLTSHLRSYKKGVFTCPLTTCSLDLTTDLVIPQGYRAVSRTIQLGVSLPTKDINHVKR
jgi:hypothetical protein